MLNRKSFSLAIILAALASPALAQNTGGPAAVDQQKFRAAQQDTGNAIQELGAIVKDPAVYTDPAKKAEALKAALPIFDRIDANVAEFQKVGLPGRSLIRQIGAITNPVRVALGEPKYLAQLEKDAAGTDKKAASSAKGMLALASFLTAAEDEKLQDKAVDAFAAALKADPASDEIAANLNQCYSSRKTAKAVKARIEKLIKEDAKSDTAKNIIMGWEAAQKLASIPGKPLTVKNFTLDGKPFSSDALKGKVVMVDFWATWCGPCIAELPRLVETYNKYHPQGLEIISISFDQDVATINKFLGDHKEITWTQLFNPKSPGWQAGQDYGIQAIPQMFLIDKKGVCRTIHGRQEMETLIPKLLEE